MALTKIDDRGLKTPIDLLDNEKIRLGTGNDLEIYHNGTYSEIKNTTGGIYLENTSEIGFISGTYASGEWILKGTPNGSVDLYYNGVKKFETTSTGTKVTGDFTVDYAGTATLGGSSLLLKRSTGNTNYINAPLADADLVISADENLLFHTVHTADFNSTERMRIDSSGKIGIGETSPSTVLHLKSGSNTAATLQTTNNGSSVSSNYNTPNRIFYTGVDIGGVNSAYTIYDGTASAERMRITSDGKLWVATTTDNTDAPVVARCSAGYSFAAIKDNTAPSIAFGGVTQPRVLLEARHNASTLQFHTATGSTWGSPGWTTRMEVESNGNVKITDGDLVIGTSGHGIDFSATSGTGTSELLDDYEEGTWTPTIFGETTAGSYSYEAVRTGGRYTKIGNLVYIEGVLRISAINTAGAGHLHFGGLPFPLGATPASSWSIGRGITIIHYGTGTNSTATDDPPPFVGVGYSGASTIEMRGYGKNYNKTPDITDFTAQYWIYQITGCYQV